MNIVTGTKILMAAKAGRRVSVNTMIRMIGNEDEETFIYGTKARNAGFAALMAIAALLQLTPDILQTPFAFALGDARNGGEVIVFSQSKGKEAIPGFFDVHYTYPVVLVNKEEKDGPFYAAP